LLGVLQGVALSAKSGIAQTRSALFETAVLAGTLWPAGKAITSIGPAPVTARITRTAPLARAARTVGARATAGQIGLARTGPVVAAHGDHGFGRALARNHRRWSRLAA
jgi:hypothetical protein